MGLTDFLERPSGLRRFPGTIANICQGEFLPEATMHGLLNLYRTVQRGLLDAKARRHLSTEYAPFHKMGLGLQLCIDHQQGPKAGTGHSVIKDKAAVFLFCSGCVCGILTRG